MMQAQVVQDFFTKKHKGLKQGNANWSKDGDGNIKTHPCILLKVSLRLDSHPKDFDVQIFKLQTELWL